MDIKCLLATILLFGVCGVTQPRKFVPPKIGWRGLETTTTYTPSDYGYNHLWVTVESRTNLVFQVRACSDAHVALSMFEGATSDYSTEIIIGGWHNTQSQIRNLFSVGYWFSTYTPKVVHCNEYRYFWLSWANNYIEVGRGPTVGIQKFMNYQFKSLHAINAVGFSSGYGYTGSWKISTNLGNTIIQRTPVDKKYQYMWRSVVEREYITFGVTACQTARITLAERSGDIRFRAWEVVLGGFNNRETYVKESPISPDPRYGRRHQVSLYTTALTPNILSCNESRLFWIGWSGGYVQVGRGMYYGQQVIASLDDRNSSHAVNAISVATSEATGRWLFNDNSVGSTSVYTPPNTKYRSMWLESVRSKFLSFYVRACSDAGIILSAAKGVEDDWAFQVVLGADSNTVSGLKPVIGVGWTLRTNTPNILSCNDSREFWVSWGNSTVEVGRGSFYDQRTRIFKHAAWKEHPVAAVSFITSSPVNGEWTVKKNMGEIITVNTDAKGDHKYTRMWRSVANQKMIAFTIKACHDAHILLAKTRGKNDSDIYEFVIGGWHNSRSVIRKKVAGEFKAVSDTKGLLNCTEARPFWISWVNGQIKAGQGYLFNRKRFLYFNDPNPVPISAISVSTGYDAGGEWTFEEYIGEKAILYTPPLENYATKFITVTGTSLQFDVRACSEARLRLADGGSNFYSIVIGGQSNTVSRITKNNDVKTEKQIPDLLACELSRSFWVSWDGGVLAVGTGKVVGFRPFIGYQDVDSPISVQTVRFSTAQGSDANWIINEEAGRTLTYDTPQDWTNFRNRLWVTTKESEYVVFNVKACSEVFVLLSSMLGVSTRFAYEVVLGGWKGRRSVIRQRGWQGGAHHAESFERILDCAQMRTFWITWAGGHIVVGKGNVVGQNRLMDWLDMSPHRVAALGFTTGYGVSGLWNFNIAKDLQPTSPPVASVPLPTPAPPPKPPTRVGATPGQQAGIAIGIILGVAVVAVVVVMVLKPDVRNKAIDGARSAGQRVKSLPPFNRLGAGGATSPDARIINE